MALAGLAYVLGVFILDRGRLAARFGWLVVCCVAAVIQLSMLLMPALLSSDIIDYASHGRVASLHAANPYVVPPASFPSDPFSALGAWPTVVTVYGPLWTRIDAAVTGALPNGYVAELALAYKALALASVIASAVLIVWIVRSWNSIGITTASPVVALAMWAWNPLVNVEIVGNAHNEAVMILLVLVAFALLTDRDRRARGLSWLARYEPAVGALIKFVPIAIAAIAGLVWLRRMKTPMDRARRARRRRRVYSWSRSPRPGRGWTRRRSASRCSAWRPAVSASRMCWQDAPAAWLTVRFVPRLGVPDDPATLRMDVARTMVWSVTRVLFVAYVGIEAWWLLAAVPEGGPASAAHDRLDVERVPAAGHAAVRLAGVRLVLPVATAAGVPGWLARAVDNRRGDFGLAFLVAYYLREFQPYGVFYVPIYRLVGLAILALIRTGEQGARLSIGALSVSQRLRCARFGCIGRLALGLPLVLWARWVVQPLRRRRLLHGRSASHGRAPKAQSMLYVSWSGRFARRC